MKLKEKDEDEEVYKHLSQEQHMRI